MDGVIYLTIKQKAMIAFINLLYPVIKFVRTTLNGLCFSDRDTIFG